MPRPSAPELAGTAPTGAGRFSRAASRAVPLLQGMSTRKLGVVAVALGLLLTLPALWTGFAQDDHFFLMVFKGSPGFNTQELGPLETFSFSKGDPADRHELMERGLLPWWTVEGWKLNFWRPISSLSSWLDYHLFGTNAWAMHLHSLVLYGILILIATVLYRRLIEPRWAAGLAAIAFAIDSGHAIPVTWLAMRNAILTLLFGLLLLAAHDRWRKARAEGRPGWFFGGLALLWLALALLSGESGVSVGGYLLAYALFLDPAVRMSGGEQGWLSRCTRSVAALLPYLAVVILWRMAYSSLGYGTEGSGLYIDPVADPAEFLWRLPVRLAVLLLGLLAMPDAMLWSLTPAPWSHVQLALAIFFLGVFGWAVLPLLLRSPEARFMLVGSVLAAVPGCATLPMDRLMMFSSFGALGLAAMLLADMAECRAGGIRGRIRSPLAVFLIVSHFVVAPLGLIAGTQHIRIMNKVLNGSNPSIPVDLPESTRVVAINTPNDLLGGSLPIHRSSRGEPLVQHWWWLYSGMGDLSVEREDANTIILRPEAGYFTTPWADIFRLPASDPIAVGDRFSLDGLDIEVLNATPEGAPTEVRFRFDVPLEDPSLRLVSWQDGTYVPFIPPAPGASVEVSGGRIARLLNLVLDRK